MSTGYGNSTTGLNVAAQIGITAPLNNPPAPGGLQPGGTQVLSLSSTSPDFSSYQIPAEVQDASGNPLTGGTAFTLTAVASSSGTSPADAVYTGTITGGGSNAFVGYVFVVTGFTNAVNNGTFQCVASSATTLTLANASATSETHAATATLETTSALEYNLLYNTTPNGNGEVISVTSDGFVSALNIGYASVEVSYPFAANALGNTPSGWPYEKIYREINFEVIK